MSFLQETVGEGPTENMLKRIIVSNMPLQNKSSDKKQQLHTVVGGRQ